MKSKKIIIIAICFIVIGFILLAIKSTQKTASLHLKLNEFHTVLLNTPSKLKDVQITVYGLVKEGSIHKTGIEADFKVIENGNNLELDVHFTGKTLLPDTFKEGSQVAVTGIYLEDRKVFFADSVLAKCASRYENSMK